MKLFLHLCFAVVAMAAAVPSRKMLETLVADSMRQMDKDGDHRISLTESRAYFEQQYSYLQTYEDYSPDYKTFMDEMDAEFRKTDADNDGQLTKDEIVNDEINRLSAAGIQKRKFVR